MKIMILPVNANNMTIAVTSASGQLGAAIVQQLIDEVGKENVIGIARTPEHAHGLGIEIRKGDYNSREQLDTVLLVSGMDDPEK